MQILCNWECCYTSLHIPCLLYTYLTETKEICIVNPPIILQCFKTNLFCNEMEPSCKMYCTICCTHRCNIIIRWVSSKSRISYILWYVKPQGWCCNSNSWIHQKLTGLLFKAFYKWTFVQSPNILTNPNPTYMFKHPTDLKWSFISWGPPKIKMFNDFVMWLDWKQ